MYKKKSLIIGGTSVNINNKKNFQLEEMGFSIKKDNGVCEGLNLFSSINTSDDFINLFVELGDFLVEDLKKRNKKIVYATCPRKLKGLYQLLGFTVIDKIIIDNEKKILLKFDLYNMRIKDYEL